MHVEQLNHAIKKWTEISEWQERTRSELNGGRLGSYTQMKIAGRAYDRYRHTTHIRGHRAPL
jgi:hypothetical protein